MENCTVSPTYLRTAFLPVAPKRVRIQSSCQYLFTLLGSTGAKAARRMLMKLTPSVVANGCIFKMFFENFVFVCKSCYDFSQLFLKKKAK